MMIKDENNSLFLFLVLEEMFNKKRPIPSPTMRISFACSLEF
jgi:hypothetical protein